MAKVDKRGRTKSGPPFAQLHRYLVESAAWRDLKPQDRAVYLEVLILYNGKNNGFLALGQRDAAERANINKDTAGASFRRLVEHGFLETAQSGGFSYKIKHATEWRLTQFSCDRTNQPPSKAFLRWSPAANDGPLNSDTRPPNFGPSAAKMRASVP